MDEESSEDVHSWPEFFYQSGEGIGFVIILVVLAIMIPLLYMINDSHIASQITACSHLKTSSLQVSCLKGIGK